MLVVTVIPVRGREKTWSETYLSQRNGALDSHPVGDWHVLKKSSLRADDPLGNRELSKACIREP